MMDLFFTTMDEMENNLLFVSFDWGFWKLILRNNQFQHHLRCKFCFQRLFSSKPISALDKSWVICKAQIVLPVTCTISFFSLLSKDICPCTTDTPPCNLLAFKSYNSWLRTYSILCLHSSNLRSLIHWNNGAQKKRSKPYVFKQSSSFS